MRSESPERGHVRNSRQRVRGNCHNTDCKVTGEEKRQQGTSGVAPQTLKQPEQASRNCAQVWCLTGAVLHPFCSHTDSNYILLCSVQDHSTHALGHINYVDCSHWQSTTSHTLALSVHPSTRHHEASVVESPLVAVRRHNQETLQFRLENFGSFIIGLHQTLCVSPVSILRCHHGTALAMALGMAMAREERVDGPTPGERSAGGVLRTRTGSSESPRQAENWWKNPKLVNCSSYVEAVGQGGAEAQMVEAKRKERIQELETLVAMLVDSTQLEDFKQKSTEEWSY